MTPTLSAPVWLASGNAAFLLLTAFALDALARRIAMRSRDWRSGGFTYHEDHDAWVCPQDQWLWPQSFDPEHRVMRYRASPAVCRSCPVKDTCTTSDLGREVARAVDPWPSSEAERFHRGIACALAVLALVWPLVTMATARTGTEVAVLAGVSAVVAAASWPLWSHLRRTQVAFPEAVRVQTLDETVANRSAAAAREGRWRPTYGSDQRPGVGAPGVGAPGGVAPEGGEPASGWSRMGRQ